MTKFLKNSTAYSDTTSVVHPYTNLQTHLKTGPLVITRAQGIYVFGEDGTKYMETMAGLWCTSLGWGQDRLVKAATKAMEQLPFYHSFSGKVPDITAQLAERLLSLAPTPENGPKMSKVFFANSGSEAIDTALKLVRYVNNARGRPLKKKVIARDKAYHGSTIAAASLTGLPMLHNSFDLPIEGIIRADCPDQYRGAKAEESEQDFATRLAEQLEQQILSEGPETVAAFVAEPVMGAGGVLVPPATYFQKIQAVLKKYDILFIVDEVICGFGRTGNMWGSQTFDLCPDMITTAKALSSAYLPISALMISEEIFQDMVKESGDLGVFGHGFTYGGHPVACAVALETLNMYEDLSILSHVENMSSIMQKGLRNFQNHPLVGDVRGVGMIGALEFVKDKTTKESFTKEMALGPQVIKRMQNHGMIGRNLTDTIAFSPPLIISKDELDDMFTRMSLVLDETYHDLKANGHIN